LLPCYNWIKFEIFAFRLRTYGGWNRQPVAIGRTPLGDIKDDDFPSRLVVSCVYLVTLKTLSICGINLMLIFILMKACIFIYLARFEFQLNVYNWSNSVLLFFFII
jgi:hypothetical protein